MTWKTHRDFNIIYQYCFSQSELKLFLYKKMKFISIKGNDEYESPC